MIGALVSARSGGSRGGVIAQLGNPDKRDDRDENDRRKPEDIVQSKHGSLCVERRFEERHCLRHTSSKRALQRINTHEEITQETYALGRTKVFLAVVVHR